MQAIRVMQLLLLDEWMSEVEEVDWNGHARRWLDRVHDHSVLNSKVALPVHSLHSLICAESYDSSNYDSKPNVRGTVGV